MQKENGQNGRRAEDFDFCAITAPLTAWFNRVKRDLPWRENPTPYRVWVSEIMLQQTRVEAAKDYYLRFLNALPAVEDLAACDEETLMKLWEGLGYYSRARNLHKTAKIVCEEYGGAFPSDEKSLRALPGIGDYTVGAIRSIAFGLPSPAVDGNVLRVVMRLTDFRDDIADPKVKKAVRAQIQAVMPEAEADIRVFNQATMELGATVCGPNRTPDCPRCPCAAHCLGYAHGTAVALPAKLPKREKRQEEKTVFILQCDGCFALRRRPPKGLLAGLWEFPNVPGTLTPEAAIGLLGDWNLRPSELEKSITRKHIFTHIVWEMRGIYAQVREKAPEFTWMTPGEIDTQAALPTAFRLFWEETEHV